MTDETTRDDQLEAEAVGRLLDELARDDALDAPAAGPRESLELLGLLGASVEPIEPPPAIRERLLAEVGGGAIDEARAEVVALPPPAAASPGPPRRWALPLAASLAIALAGVAGYQAALLADQRATIGQLSERLEQVEARTPAVSALEGQLAAMRARMALITGRGVEICALKPMLAESRQANSRGVLYVAANHQHWYLTIDGLRPCEEGRSYQLWFVPEDGEPVSAGTFDVMEGVRVELSSESMPAATRAITITLEPAGGSERPTGPAVLHGDEVMAIL